MASRLLINSGEVRSRYSLQDLKDINSALDSGIPGAHIFFQGILGTPFDEATLTDVFYLNPAVVGAYNKMFRLRLKQAFVKAGSLSVKMGDSTAPETDVEATGFHVDLVRGLVYVQETGPDGSNANKYVAITYTAGFGIGTAAAVPPDWLKEALLSWMASVLVFSAYKEEPQKALPIAEAIKREAAALVERYKRETALQHLPIY